jgi:hypothetical protein
MEKKMMEEKEVIQTPQVKPKEVTPSSESSVKKEKVNYIYS